MADLIIITAFCPTEEQESALDRCIESVLKCGFHIALISHTHIPIHIQKKCNYYVYDYLNDVSDEVDLLGHEYFIFDNSRIQSRFFNKTFYGFAIYRMFSIASQLAINFGYDNIHHIEYDCELLDKYLILENSKLLETYDSIIYTDSGNEDGMLFGSFKSFKVKSLPDKFKNYDRDFIEIEIKKAQPSRLEYLTKDLFINSGKVLFGPEPSVNRFKRGATFYNRNLHHTLYYSEQDQNLHLFYKSVTNVSELICVIINNSQVIMIEVLPNTWSIRHLGLFDEINHVRIDNSAKIIYQKSFDSQDKELFKIKSYLLKVK
jgi:hypothetical protein